MEEEILKYFYTNHNNSTSVIAKKFNIPHHTVSDLIEYDLSKKANYYIDEVNPKINYKPNKIEKNVVRVLDEFDNFYGDYKSFAEASRYLGLHNTTIAYQLNGCDKKTVYHRLIDKTYTYIRL